MKRHKISLVVIKNNIRLHDNPALFYAAKQKLPIVVMCIDEKLTGSASRWWRLKAVRDFRKVLESYKIQVIFSENTLADCKMIAQLFEIIGIYYNDEIPQLFFKALDGNHISFHKFSHNRLFSNFFIDTQIKVFTVFAKKAFEKVSKIDAPLPLPQFNDTHNSYCLHNVMTPISEIKGIKWWGEMENFWEIGEKAALDKWESFRDNINDKGILLYEKQRDIMSIDGTSLLSPHIHFGEISVRKILYEIKDISEEQSVYRFILELFWREFSYHTLEHMPDYYYRSKLHYFDEVEWEDDELILKKWQHGKTGCPIVDAGMRQLWKIGWMHNRVRMIVASFLIKNLNVKWQYGAAWFLDTLVDADVASNAFGWQWVSGSGVSASPYFRVMNPFVQSQKFDKNGGYIRKWVDELKTVQTKQLHESLNEQYTPLIVDLSKTKALFLEKIKRAMIERNEN